MSSDMVGNDPDPGGRMHRITVRPDRVPADAGSTRTRPRQATGSR